LKLGKLNLAAHLVQRIKSRPARRSDIVRAGSIGRNCNS